MIDRYAIAREAREWVGTRWHHQASLKGVGTDCIGLVIGVAHACGVTEAAQYKAAPELHGYGREPDPIMLLSACARFLNQIRIADATIGDVLLFRFAQQPQHFAIISRTDPKYIVHAYAQVRRAVENRLDDMWAARTLYAFRFRGII